ncbi:MAG: large conductance mechanosensitive channel protein MscL [Christensenellaceae bacterium]|jgi:large conductance mechanosensitive channel|nr:large conductance mechanosensitive channel protein MscL [Christensenellaceae bacterium]
MAKKQMKMRFEKARTFFEDFKKFISKGNIIDLAVAVVIGGAFTKIINSLVADLIMPLIGLIVGSSDLTNYRWHIAKDVYINWGNIVTAILDFLIVAFLIFTILKIVVNAQRGVTKLARKDRKALANQSNQAVAPEPEPIKIESTEDILKDIRALLQGKDETNETETTETETDEEIAKDADLA